MKFRLPSMMLYYDYDDLAAIDSINELMPQVFIQYSRTRI